MKMIFGTGITFFFISMFVSFISCSDDSTNSSTSYYFTAKHSGFSQGDFNAVNVTAAETEGVLNVFGYLGTIGQSTYIQLTILNAVEGSQIVDLSDPNKGTAGFIIYNNNTYNIFTAVSGTINISKNNTNEVEGTFSFTAKNPLNDNMNVTEGKFRSKKINI